MKYTIEGFSQQKLVEFGLDNTDALILRWFTDFMSRMDNTIHEGRVYYWIYYQSIIDELPCIGINNKRVIARKLDNLVHLGIFDKYVKKLGGTFTYFAATEKFMTLVSSTQSTKKYNSCTEIDNGGVQKVQQGLYRNEQTKTHLLNNPSTKQLLIIEKDNTQQEPKQKRAKEKLPIDNNHAVSEIVDYFAQVRRTKPRKDKQIATGLIKILQDYSPDEVKLVIDWVCQDDWYIEKKYTTLSVIARSEKFADKLERANNWVEDRKIPFKVTVERDVMTNQPCEYLYVFDKIEGDWVRRGKAIRGQDMFIDSFYKLVQDNGFKENGGTHG